MKKIGLTLLIAIIILLVVGPLVVPVPELEDTVPPADLVDPDSLFIEVNGIDIHYKDAGQGKKNFILLHGFGASLFTWHRVFDQFKTYGRVIAFDRPAFGLTERPLVWEGDNPYSPDFQVRLVIGLMDRLNIEQAILVGNSAGGKIALETAIAHPDRIQALILVDAAVYAGGGAPQWIVPLLNTPQLERIGPLIARQIQKRGDQFIRSAWHDPSLITTKILEGYKKPLRAENWDKALWELTLASTESDLENQLDRVRMPALVISGDDDRIVPTQQSIRLAEEIKGASLSVLENCGHVPHEECPLDFFKAIENFLQEFNL